MARILTAVAPDTEERVRRSDAEAALENDNIELILVGARFDESRMFDLLEYIRKDAEHGKIPIVAAIIAATRMAAATVEGNARLRIIADALTLPSDQIPLIASAR